MGIVIEAVNCSGKRSSFVKLAGPARRCKVRSKKKAFRLFSRKITLVGQFESTSMGTRWVLDRDDLTIITHDSR